MLSKAASILSLFSAEHAELRAAEIVQYMRKPRSTVYRLLGDMVSVGFLDYDDGEGSYRLGIRLATLGDLARTSTSLQRLSHPALLELTAVTGELSVLMVLSGDEGVTVDVVESVHLLNIPGTLGGRFPLHATAGGKVLLAYLPESRLEASLTAPLARLTRKTITSRATLRRQLARVRKAGFAWQECEWLSDVYAVAAPVFDHRGDVVAAIGAATIGNRWQPAHARALTRAVVAAAARVSRAQGFSEGSTPGRRNGRVQRR